MKQPEPYWSYRHEPVPELPDLPPGHAFVGTEANFNRLPPGMRGEIYRSAMKRAQPAPAPAGGVDDERLARADALNHLAQVQIEAREALWWHRLLTTEFGIVGPKRGSCLKLHEGADSSA